MWKLAACLLLVGCGVAEVNQPAVWSWFQDPRAVHDDGRTFITWHDSGIWVGGYDGSSWETFKLMDAPADDHNVGAIHVRPDGRLLAVYGLGIDGDGMFRRVSTNPGDVTSWGSETKLVDGNLARPNIVYLPDEARYYFFYRTPVNRGLSYLTSNDNGDTWSEPNDLVVNQGGENTYVKIGSDDNTIHFILAHSNPSGVDTVYHFYFSDGGWFASDGTDLGEPPFVHTDFTAVFQADPADEGNPWVWDMAAEGPTALITSFPTPEDHRYHYATWDGGWTVEEMTAAGGTISPTDQDWYSGGLALNHQDPSIVFLSRKVGDTWEIERWQTQDAGATWSTQAITSDTPAPNINARPVVVRGDSRVIWFQGDYVTFRDFSTVLKASPPLTLPEEEPEPEPEFGSFSQAEIRTAVTWLGCDLATGRIIAELPDLTGGRVSRALGAYTSDAQTLPIPLEGPASVGQAGLQATEPRRTLLVAVVNNVPAWAGLVLQRVGGTHATLNLGCVTPEGYFARRIVRDHTFTKVDEATIASTLARDAEAGILDGVEVGQGLGLVHDAPPTGTLRDRTYARIERSSVLQRLTELSNVLNGLEWTIDLDWTDASQTAIRLIFRVRKRIGVAATDPKAVFETTARSVFGSKGSSDATYEYEEDWSEGRGANWVEAYSTGEGDDQPSSAPAVDLNALNSGVPIFEQHFQPASKITTQSVLDDHAAAQLARVRNGTQLWRIAARWDATPRYGVDWQLGDDVAWELVGHRHPEGVTGQGRVVGFEMTISEGRIRPMLL